MIVNLLTNFVHWSFLIFLMTPTPTKQMATDSSKIVSTGTENSIIVDSSPLPPHAATTVISKNVKGTIVQTGGQNKVEINSREDTVSGQAKPTIVVNQAGNNNSVKINSE